MLLINPSCFQILLPWVIWKCPEDVKTVYLTFDDGPHPHHTLILLDILHEHDIRGSFFILGKKAVLYPDIIKEINLKGHTIGNHGYSHHKRFFMKESIVRDEICRTETALFRITGKKPIWFRPPYGRFDFRYKQIMSDLGYRMVIWSLLSYDFREKKPARLIHRVSKQIHPGTIILFHDDNPHTPVMLDALPKIIQSLFNEGYRFKTLDDLPANQIQRNH
jgi:peptidoglycan/xylan/chitin deacetylase (PgdA/CDA1 family)